MRKFHITPQLLITISINASGIVYTTPDQTMDTRANAIDAFIVQQLMVVQLVMQLQHSVYIVSQQVLYQI